MEEILSRWNILAKRQDEIYHRWALKAGLTDTQFWAMYALCEEKHEFFQHKFCENWSFSTKTVSTAVACLEAEGLIDVYFTDGPQRMQKLKLTPLGMDFCDKHIRKVQVAENEILAGLVSHDRDVFFDRLEQLLDRLEQMLEEEE